METETLKRNPRPATQSREGVGITYRAIVYETSGKLYTQIDCETDLDIVKMLISGSPTIQGGIWVVNAVEGNHTRFRGAASPCAPDATSRQ